MPPQIEGEQNSLLPPQLALIRDDILFMYSRAYNPELAADALYDRLVANGVTADDIEPIISALQASGDQWLEQLAAFGIDLRGNPTWATAVIRHLVGAFAEDNTEVDNPGGNSGGESNA